MKHSVHALRPKQAALLCACLLLADAGLHTYSTVMYQLTNGFWRSTAMFLFGVLITTVIAILTFLQSKKGICIVVTLSMLVQTFNVLRYLPYMNADTLNYYFLWCLLFFFLLCNTLPGLRSVAKKINRVWYLPAAWMLLWMVLNLLKIIRSPFQMNWFWITIHLLQIGYTAIGCFWLAADLEQAEQSSCKNAP